MENDEMIFGMSSTASLTGLEYNQLLELLITDELPHIPRRNGECIFHTQFTYKDIQKIQRRLRRWTKKQKLQS